ncbi:MAG: hypothetical protein ACM30G_23170 [Micromonosporaceae bacterium]
MPAIVKDSRFWWGVAAGFFVAPMALKFVSMQTARLKARAAG